NRATVTASVTTSARRRMGEVGSVPADGAVGVEHELLRCALVEVLVARGRLVQGDHLRVDGVGDVDLVPEDRLHELAVVLHDRALAGGEGVGLGPAQADADAEVAGLGRLVHATRVVGDVQAGDADGPARPGDLHQRVEDGGGRLVRGVVAVAPGLEAHAVDGRVDLGHADDLLDLLGHRGAGRHVDRLAPEAAGLGQALGDEVAHDHAGGAQQLGRRGRGQAHGAAAGDVHDAARAHAGADGAVVAGGEDVGQAGEVADLLQGLVPVREAEQVEVGVGHHHVLGLAAHPATHVHVAVGGAGPGRVHAQADARPALLAVAAAAAGDVEGHGHQVAHLDELDIPARLHHLAGDLVAEHQPGGSRGPAPHHVLVAPTDVGGDDLEDDAVIAAPVPQRQFGEVDGLDLDLARLDVCNSAVVGHPIILRGAAGRRQ